MSDVIVKNSDRYNYAAQLGLRRFMKTLDKHTVSDDDLNHLNIGLLL